MARHLYEFKAVDVRNGGRTTINRSVELNKNDIQQKFIFLQDVILTAQRQGYINLQLVSEQIQDQ